MWIPEVEISPHLVLSRPKFCLQIKWKSPYNESPQTGPFTPWQHPLRWIILTCHHPSDKATVHTRALSNTGECSNCPLTTPACLRAADSLTLARAKTQSPVCFPRAPLPYHSQAAISAPSSPSESRNALWSFIERITLSYQYDIVLSVFFNPWGLNQQV